MKTAAIIQAHTKSSQLPEKVLMEIGGIPALELLINRIWNSNVDQVIVATTIDSIDIIKKCQAMACNFFIGPEKDVMERVLETAVCNAVDVIVDITADCPLIDPKHINKLMEMQVGRDYTSNVVERTWPNGFDIQVYNTSSLFRVYKLLLKEERLHVGWHIAQHPDLFDIVNWPAPPDMHWPELRITLDEKEDLILLDKIVTELGPNCEAKEIVNFLKWRR